jgi:hypothetical protein
LLREYSTKPPLKRLAELSIHHVHELALKHTQFALWSSNPAGIKSLEVSVDTEAKRSSWNFDWQSMTNLTSLNAVGAAGLRMFP